MVEVAGKQATTRVGNAQRAMNKNLQFDVGAFLADLGDFIKRQFAREDDARDAELLPEAHGGKIDGIGLYG